MTQSTRLWRKTVRQEPQSNESVWTKVRANCLLCRRKPPSPATLSDGKDMRCLMLRMIGPSRISRTSWMRWYV